ncbi:MAG TPA: HEAT repeat domain-containing protein [Candidatus Bilamarchaeum sp.]|nr:HEAT repeat domain-containing protein [Candidatus Bilamarchaeum sp.]
MEGGVSGFVAKLGSSDPLERFGALASIREALERGEDIGPAEGAVTKALSDRDKDVREKAARVLVYFYGRKKDWKRIDALLSHANADVRASAIFALETFAGKFSPATDIPGLLKALDDQSFDVRAEAVSLFAKAAESGQDIAFAVPGIRRAAIYGDEKVKENAGRAISASGVKKGD